jgi:hypothetical protein
MIFTRKHVIAVVSEKKSRGLSNGRFLSFPESQDSTNRKILRKLAKC